MDEGRFLGLLHGVISRAGTVYDRSCKADHHALSSLSPTVELGDVLNTGSVLILGLGRFPK
jgi:hypothetical protein